ncbi:MAG: sigma-54-dependent Fis family transcriptional regulator [Spirochaetota bacterium]|nr:MAG: sigma-54-dependent Fis family transcriptional regulator [Spirochaetota bacterium]
MNKNILVIDDEEIQANIITDILKKEGYNVTTGYSAEEALKIAQKDDFSVMLVDLKMPGMGGLGFLKKIKGSEITANIIIMTAYGTIETAVEAMKSGAYDYILKPFNKDELLLNVEKAIKAFNLFSQNFNLKEELEDICGERRLIGSSEAIKGIYKLIDKVSKSDAVNVLITGESGSGKELVAREIHAKSKRADMPFIPVNCSAIPETLLESELFGYEKGAFTGALNKRDGKFKRANGGTLFLDEIGDMPLNMQAKLLRVIQDGEISPVGGDKTFSVDVRIISATNRDIEDMVKKGEFREDLFYRLNVVPIYVPPLRERREDIPVLVNFLIERLNKKLKKNIKELPETIMSRIIEYHFPGNVRELENMLERAFILAEDKNLKIDHFSLIYSYKIDKISIVNSRSLKDISREARRKAERDAVNEALIKTNWNRVKAARLLGVDYKTLRNKIEELGIIPNYSGERSNS